MSLEQFPLGRKAAAYFGDTTLANVEEATITTWLSSATKWSNQYDVTYNTTPEYADITTREAAANNFTAQKPVIMNGEVTFEVTWNTNDVGNNLQAMIDAAMDNEPVALAFLDADKDSVLAAGEVVQGLVGNFFVSFQKMEAIRDVQKASFTATSAGDLAWHKIVGS